MMKKLFLAFIFCAINKISIKPNPQTNPFFKKNKTLYSTYQVVTNPLHLRELAKDMLYYLESPKGQESLKNPDYFKNYMNLNQTKETLRFVIRVINEDESTSNFRILDPQFLQENFGSIRWHADRETAKKKHNKILPEDGKIRLTSYVLFKVNGSKKKTRTFNHALYQLLDESVAKKYTRQEVFDRVFEDPENKNKVLPLVWLKKHDLQEALMQGSAIVRFPDKTSQLYNVHINNSYEYDRSKGKYDQKRYWFFKELHNSYWFFRNVKGKYKNWLNQVNTRKNIALAGDVDNIGYGKLVALFFHNPQTKKKEMRLGIIADTGGAFKNNLYQLDLFGGCIEEHNLKEHLATVPPFVHACFLYKK